MNTDEFTNRVAVITGASRGVGAAIARRLASLGADTILAGRDLERLSEVRNDIAEGGGSVEIMSLDLAEPESVESLAESILRLTPAVDILVNCGGHYSRGQFLTTSEDELRRLLEVNLIGTFSLTRKLLPSLIASRGDIVFINSSIVNFDGKGAGHYAASRHAMKGLTDALRAEVNELGVRVLSVYPGRTATPGQREIHRLENKPYRPDRLLQADDVAQATVSCLLLPPTAEVTEIRIRPRFKA